MKIKFAHAQNLYLRFIYIFFFILYRRQWRRMQIESGQGKKKVILMVMSNFESPPPGFDAYVRL